MSRNSTSLCTNARRARRDESSDVFTFSLGGQKRQEDGESMSAFMDWLNSDTDRQLALIENGYIALARKNIEQTWVELLKRPLPALHCYKKPATTERPNEIIWEHTNNNNDDDDDSNAAPGMESDTEDSGLYWDIDECGDDDEEQENEIVQENESITHERTKDMCVVVDDRNGVLCRNKATLRCMCRKHYQRWRRSPESRCSVPECDSMIKRDGLCHGHYRARIDNTLSCQNETNKQRICEEQVFFDDGTSTFCNRIHYARGMCKKHYSMATKRKQEATTDWTNKRPVVELRGEHRHT